MFTLNNPEDDADANIAAKFEAGEFSYCVYQLERGENGTLHFQGYMEFDKKMRLSAVRKILARAHWEKRKGSQAEAIAYCSKLDTRENPGTEPISLGEKKKQGARNDLDACKEIIDGGGSISDIQEYDFKTWAKNHRAFDRYKRDKTSKRNWKMEVLVLWGVPGSGKTKRAFDEYGNDCYFKPVGDWWDGYNGEETVILDDFYGTLPYGFLLKLLDRYPLMVPFKGGFHQFTSKRLVFTSNVSWEEWYDFENNPKFKKDALRRRFTSVTFFPYAMPEVEEEEDADISHILDLDDEAVDALIAGLDE